MSTTPLPIPEAPAIKKERRIINRWSVFALVVFSAIATMLFVSNVVRVNALLKEVQSLERERDALVASNESLRIQVTRLESNERITTIARDKLGMTQPSQAPIILHDSK